MHTLLTDPNMIARVSTLCCLVFSEGGGLTQMSARNQKRKRRELYEACGVSPEGRNEEELERLITDLLVRSDNFLNVQKRGLTPDKEVIQTVGQPRKGVIRSIDAQTGNVIVCFESGRPEAVSPEILEVVKPN